MAVSIMDLCVDFQKEPLGLDHTHPQFSWKLESDLENVYQKTYRITVSNGETCVWDSEEIKSKVTTGVTYQGEPLEPLTRYQVKVWTRTNQNQLLDAETSFETGFLNPDIEAWDGAKWIASPRYEMYAVNRGIFQIETEFSVKEGGRAGIVFGDGDYRLLDPEMNEYGMCGENYIRYEINGDHFPQKETTLDIYRVGYAPGDSAEVPFAAVPLEQLKSLSEGVFHKLQIDVSGNMAKAYVDGKFVNEVQLNPRGHNDVLTYPRLNKIGFFAEKEEALFRYYRVKNLREPKATVINETPEGSLYGEDSIFHTLVPVKDGCFAVSHCQVSAFPHEVAVPMFRTEFAIDKNKAVKNARLYITARGIYDPAINGRKITDRVLTPGVTQYDKRINYQTYDISEYVVRGNNGIGVVVSSGWWCDAQTYFLSNYNLFGDKEALLCKIRVVYEDNTEDIFTTDTENWKCYNQGPYRYGGFFLGEVLDARSLDVYHDFSKEAFGDADWETPVEYAPVYIPETPRDFGRNWPAVNNEEPYIEGGYDAPVKIICARKAEKVIKVSENRYIYDLGQEMAGVPRIKLREADGTKVVIRYGEMLYPHMERYGKNGGKLMVENYRDATSTDFYFCQGLAEGEVYQPLLSFHGFRYIEISGIKNPPALEEVEGLQYSTITKYEGRFQSSNQLLNRFAENVKWSQYCNFINIPTDCPQRNERMGWAGDTHVFCHTAVENANLKKFYERNLQAMMDLQENGRYPEIAPIGGGFGGITYECAAIFMTWELYQQYGDKETIRKMYSSMLEYMKYMEDKGLPGIGDPKIIGPLSDWLAPQQTDEQLMWNAFYYKEAVLMKKMSRIIGREKEAEDFSELAEKIKKFWNDTFIQKETFKTIASTGELCDTQTSYTLAIEYGLTDHVEELGQHLARKVKEDGHKVGTGFFGTGLINHALSRCGFVEDAYKMMVQTQFPSWLYPVTQGATTIWEHWDSYTNENGFGEYNAMNSFNHYSLGSVLSWLYEWVLGIQRTEEYPGYESFVIQPAMMCLTSASGGISTPYGTIESSWSIHEGKYEFDCKIPCNTTATIILPDVKVEKGSGSYHFTGTTELVD